MKIAVSVNYQQKRRMAYPEIADQLDAIWKWLAANPGAMPPETADMLARVQAVKNEIPKPREVKK